MLTIVSPSAFNISATVMSDSGALSFLSEDMAFLTSFFVIMSFSIDGSIPVVLLEMIFSS